MAAQEKTDHVNREHALLSASSSPRWLRCTPSPRLEETLPDRPSSYADEGRFAHEIAELKLRKYTTVMTVKEFNAELRKLKKDPLFQQEMISHAQTYVDYVAKIAHAMKEKPHIVIEKKVDYSNYAPEGYGTADCIIIGDGTIHVIDYKYGQGVPVGAEKNEQMMLYALGALNAYGFLFPIDKICLSIVQPRLDTIAECEMAVVELVDWGESIKPAAQMAWNGLGEFVPGKHCQFCKARSTCRARSENATALEDFGMAKPPLLSDEEVGEILLRGETLASWVSDLKDYALNRCLNGGEIPGWKAVNGRSTRQFTDQDAAFAKLTETGWDEALLYQRVPLSLAKVETVLGKPEFKKLLSDFVVSPPGKPALAKDGDKRESIKPTSAVEDFGAPGEQQDF